MLSALAGRGTVCMLDSSLKISVSPFFFGCLVYEQSVSLSVLVLLRYMTVNSDQLLLMITCTDLRILFQTSVYCVGHVDGVVRVLCHSPFCSLVSW